MEAGETLMGSRESILGNIAKSLKESALSPSSKQEIEARLSAHDKNTVPKRGQGDHEAQMALFIAEAERVNATTEHLVGLEQVGEAVLRYLASHNLPGSVKIAPHALLDNVNWSKHPTLDVVQGPAEDSDQASLSVARAGVAETGTLVLHSGPESPTTLNFLPDNHIVLLPQSLLVGAYEEAWDLLREDSSDMPRTVNWVTGPSRSADIEQTLLLGAHGPRRLHILILNDKETT
ncbi:MAG: lactate utilization protein C [Alphaproteobacteria bacterium]|nr:lactate utilization protein C [Alphaproteobacteria bacterium]